jgi:hypothetical protein
VILNGERHSVKKKEYIQSIGTIVFAIIIGLGVAYIVDRSDSKAKQATSGDFRVTSGDLKVVNAAPDQGTIQSNTDPSITGVPAQSVPETANPSGSSLQNTGPVNVSPTSSGGLQGSGSAH